MKLGGKVACLRTLDTFASKFYDLNDLFFYARHIHQQPQIDFILRVGPSAVNVDEEMETFGKVLKLRNCFTGVGKEDNLVPSSNTLLCVNPMNF